MTSKSPAPSVPPGDSVCVVDSWPVLEWIYGNEPGRKNFREWLNKAEQGEVRLVISRINHGEIKYNLYGKHRRGELGHITLNDVENDLASLPWYVLSVDDELVDAAANLKAVYPISYADCFVAALARRYDAPILTGDPDFQKLANRGIVRLEWLGA